ncbi:hypothetical protein D3C71_880280 [compost metagenome]
MRSERGVVQRLLRDRAQAAQRIDRRTARNDGATGGEADSLAVTHGRRAIGLFQTLDVEQTVGQVVLVGLVVTVADVPVEVAVGEFEEALETTVEVPVLDVLVERTAAGFIEAAIHAGQVLAERVVDAAGAQATAGHRHRREQLLGLALVVHRLGTEGDVVGDVVGTGGEQRGAFLRGQQVVVRRGVVAMHVAVERGLHAVDEYIALVIADVGARDAGAALTAEERRATG